MITTISYTENVEEITVAYTESGDVNIIKFNEQARGPAGPSYTLPTASDTVLGGVKVGSGLTITAGVLSVSGSSYTLPIATGSVLGGIKSSSDILVDSGTGVATVATGSENGNITRLEIAGGFGILPIGVSSVFLNQNNGSITTGSSAPIQTGTSAPIETGTNGYIVTSVGGLIDTTGTGTINFGNDGTRTVLTGTATANRTIAFQDADGTVAHLSDIPSPSGYQTTAGTLALGGFSAITGTLAIANVAAETATRLATAFNAGTEDTAAADTDRLAVVSPAGGWMTLATLGTWIRSMLNAAFYRPLIVKKSTAQIDVTSSTTFVNITGLTGYALEANSTYRVEFFGEVTAGASGGYKIAITSTQAFKHTTSGTQGLGGFWPTGGTAGAPFQLSSTQIQINSRTAASTALPVVTIAIITTGANAPTIDFQFAQNASNATTSSLLTGAVGSFTKLI